MAESNFTNALPLVLAHEGGYVNHPKDPGGATMKGVTQKVYDAYRESRGNPKRSVKNIQTAEVRAIYKNQYWDLIKGDDLPAGIDYAIFDFAVNSGSAQAVKEIQRVVKAGVDGVMGPLTIRKIKQACSTEKGEVQIIRDYCERRMAFFRRLKTWRTFGKGWTRRVIGDKAGVQLSGAGNRRRATDTGVIDYAVMMALNDTAFPLAKNLLPAAIGELNGEESGKALPSNEAITKTPEGKAVLTGLGAAGTGGIATLAEIGDKAAVVGDTANNAANAVESGRVVVEVSKPLFGWLTLEIGLIVALVIVLVALGYLFWQLQKTRREIAAAAT